MFVLAAGQLSKVAKCFCLCLKKQQGLCSYSARCVWSAAAEKAAGQGWKVGEHELVPRNVSEQCGDCWGVATQLRSSFPDLRRLAGLACVQDAGELRRSMPFSWRVDWGKQD